jgi:acyl carrier protein
VEVSKKVHQMLRLQGILKQQIRTVYKKPKAKPTFWTRKDVDSQVYQVLYEYANVPDEQVSLTSNFVSDLLNDSTDKYAMYLDALELFQLRIPALNNDSRSFESGRELADWIAAQLEQQKRLIDYS